MSLGDAWRASGRSVAGYGLERTATYWSADTSRRSTEQARSIPLARELLSRSQTSESDVESLDLAVQYSCPGLPRSTDW